MTVAAVILSATPEGALADTLGQPRVRRLVDVAWSGGALPVVVVAADPGGDVARALAGSEAVLQDPAPRAAGPAGQMARGADRAMREVHGTTAVLLWPGRMAWVGPETVTSLIEAHGVAPDALLRPAWEGRPGWPVLLPVRHIDTLRAVAADLMPDDAIAAVAASVATDVIELGDPGVTHDAQTSFADLPAYEGPPDPPAGHTHEWGEDVAASAGLTSEDR